MRFSRIKRGRKTGQYKSRFEALVAAQLHHQNVDYEQTKIPYQQERFYVPDFDCGSFFIEAKGYFDSADRTKHLLIRDQHPELNIRFVFANAYTRLRRGSKTTYASWCDKYGFRWAHKEVPEEWIREMSRFKLNENNRLST